MLTDWYRMRTKNDGSKETKVSAKEKGKNGVGVLHGSQNNETKILCK